MTILNLFDTFKLEERSFRIFFSPLFVIFFNYSHHFSSFSYLLKLLSHSSLALLVNDFCNALKSKVLEKKVLVVKINVCILFV